MLLALVLGCLALYVVGIAAVSYWAGRNEPEQDYLIAGRKLGAVQITASKFAANIGAAWLITYTGFAFKYGMAVFAALAGYVAMYVVFALAAPRIQRWGRQYKALNMGDLVAARLTSPRMAAATNWLSVVAMTLTVFYSLVGGARTLEFMGMPGGYPAGVLAVALLTLFYVYLSGYRGVILTDVVQALIILVTMLLTTILLLQQQSVGELLALPAAEPLQTNLALGLALVGVIFFAAADRYQLCFAAKTPQAARRGMLAPLLPILAIIFVLMLIGIYAHAANPALHPDLAFIWVVSQQLPAVFMPVALVMFMAAIMSTIDSCLYAASSHMGLACRVTRASARRVSVIIIAACAVGSMVITSATELAIVAAAFLAISSIAMMYLVAGGTSSHAFGGALAAGTLGFAISALMMWANPAMIAIVVAAALAGLLAGYAYARVKG